MFSRKRRFYEKKTFYGAVLSAFLVIISISFWMGGETGFEPSDDLTEPLVENQQQAMSSGAEIIPIPETIGFFVVEEDEYIRIYEMQTGGNMELVRTTDIRYDLLSSEDQTMFRLGIQLETEEQLMELLQDFES